jgi:hypothetical protein
VTTYIRVKVRATGHQIDVVDSHVDPERHELVRRVPPSHVPRRPKYRVTYQRPRVKTEVQTSVPVTVEAPGLPIEAGTVEEEVGP